MEKEKSAKKYTEEFVYALAKCDIPSFLGVAKILCVKVDTLREGADKDNPTKEEIQSWIDRGVELKKCLIQVVCCIVN